MLTPILLLPALFQMFMFAEVPGPKIRLYQIPSTSSKDVNLYCIPEKHRRCKNASTIVDDCKYIISEIWILKDRTTVARIRPNSYAEKVIEDEYLAVNGQLTGYLDHFPYLSLDWTDQSPTSTSIYFCSVKITYENGIEVEGGGAPALWTLPMSSSQDRDVKTELTDNLRKLKKQNNILKLKIEERKDKVEVSENNFHVEQGLEKYEQIDNSDIDVRYISFNERYADIPLVMTSMVTLDMEKRSMYGVKIEVENLKTSGFNLSVTAANGSFLNLLQIHWISISL